MPSGPFVCGLGPSFLVERGFLLVVTVVVIDIFDAMQTEVINIDTNVSFFKVLILMCVLLVIFY